MSVPAMQASLDRRIEQRLDDWAAEYLTPLRIDWQDRNILQTLIEFGGFIPSSGGVRTTRDRTPADQVEDVVMSMSRVGWILHALILRVEYRRPAFPMEQRLQVVKKAGCEMSRAGYYNKLAEARAFVAGQLLIPSCV